MLLRSIWESATQLCMDYVFYFLGYEKSQVIVKLRW